MPYIVIEAAEAAQIDAGSLGAPRENYGKTLGSMREELSKLLGGRDDADASRLDSWINDAYIDLYTSLDLDEAQVSAGFTTESGQALYVLPYQVSTIRGVSVADSSHRHGGAKVTKTDLDTYRKWPDADGKPRYYFRQDNILVLYPTPEEAHTVVVDFWLRPLPLVEDQHSPNLGREWHEAILLNARKKGFSGLMEFDKAAPAENDFITNVRRRTDRVAKEDESRMVRSSLPHKYAHLRRKFPPKGDF